MYEKRKDKNIYIWNHFVVLLIPWQSRISHSGSNLQFSGCTEITCHWQKPEYKKVVRIRVHTLYRVAALLGFNSDVYRESKTVRNVKKIEILNGIFHAFFIYSIFSNSYVEIDGIIIFSRYSWIYKKIHARGSVDSQKRAYIDIFNLDVSKDQRRLDYI